VESKTGLVVKEKKVVVAGVWGAGMGRCGSKDTGIQLLDE